MTTSWFSVGFELISSGEHTNATVGCQLETYVGPARLAIVMPNRIRELRLERAAMAPGAFTLAALAMRLGVSEWTVRAWEHGRSRPTARHARRLAREFGVSVDALGLTVAPPLAGEAELG
jgi:DNA-binding XRE family transcriptional regulator